MKGTALTYHLYSLFSVPKIHTDLLWDLSVLFVVLSLLYFGFIFFFRNKTTSKARNKQLQRKELAPVISNFLFYEDDASKEEKYEYIALKITIRDFIKEPQNRVILKDILLDLQRDVTGESRNRLFRLYHDLDFHLDALAKLRSWRWEVISQGILELTQMKVAEAYPFIRKFINHKRSVVRKQAQIATVSLKHEGIAHFLDTNKYAISEWQQIKILEVLRNFEDFIPPKFSAWLTSSNKDVVLFSLRLIRYYNQIDASASIIELIKHKVDEIKISAIDCIKEFGIKAALPVLMAAFPKCKRETKIVVLDALGALGDEATIAFLYDVAKNETNFNIRSKALSAINTIAPETILPRENIDSTISVPVKEEVGAKDIAKEQVEAPESSGATSEVAEEKIEVTADADILYCEDLEVFDHCFMEELNEILDDIDRKDESAYLPLDFLPIVSQKPTPMTKKKKQRKAKSSFKNLDVIFEHIHPEENFRRELEQILSRIEIPDADGNVQLEYMNYKFLPFVVPNEEEQPDLTAFLEEINAMEVNGVEILMPPTLQDEDLDATEVPEPAIGIGEENNTCMLVDWDKIDQIGQEEEKEVISQKTAVPVLKEEGRSTFGFSIFEELFRHCDAESKLILLDEILDLGDTKELRFLENLKHDPNGKVRQKALVVAAQLAERLERQESELTKSDSYIKWPPSVEEPAYLQVNFELRGNKNSAKRK